MSNQRERLFETLAANGVKYKAVAVTVLSTATTGSSAADPVLVNGIIFGYYPSTNQDQFVKSIAVNADGSVTVTLLAAATANNVFKVLVLYPA